MKKAMIQTVKNELDLIRAINDAFGEEISKDANVYDKLQFFKSCKKPIREFIESQMPSVLFFGLSVGNLSNDDYELLKFDNLDTEFNYFGEARNNAIQEKINKFLEDTRNDTIINLTSLLLKAEYGPDLFLSECSQYFDSYKSNGIITPCNKFGERPYSFDLSNLSDTEDFDKFIYEETNIVETNKFIGLIDVSASQFKEVIKYLWHYKAITREARHLSPIIHLIRPRMAKPEYNLLLTIVTQKGLEVREVALLNDIVYRIMSMAAMKGEREKSDREFVDKALAYKHTIFNLFPVVKNLLWLAKNHKEANKSQQAIEKLEKNISVWDICNRSIYNHIEKEDGHMLSGKSIIDIIHFLKETHTTKGKEPVVTNLNTNQELDYKPNIEHLADSFIVLWNFWHNASKISAGNGFEVVIFEANQKLLITFKNQVPAGELSKKANNAIRFLKDESDVSVKKNGGTEIAKQIIAKKLNWQIDYEQTHFKDNIFSLTIHLKPLQL